MIKSTTITDDERGSSAIGLGCVTFGREVDENTSFQIMDYAFARGITFFDTAAAYGSGASEKIVGAWFASRRPPVGSMLLATKILPPYDPESIERSVDASLSRLRVETIDVLYIHRWDASFESDATTRALDTLVSKSKVKMLGASNFTAEQLVRAVQRQTGTNAVKFKFSQNNHNLAVSEIDDELKAACLTNDVSLISYSPLGAGFLTGKYQLGLEKGSRFDVVPGHQRIYFNESANLRLEKLLEVAAGTGHSAAHLALAWALHQPGIETVLVGARSISHVEQALHAKAFNDCKILNELETD